MAKHFRRRICRVISATLQSCRSKDPSILPEQPIPSFSTVKVKPNHHHHHRNSSFNHHVSNNSAPTPPPDKQTPDSKDFKWQHEDKWHVVAKIYQQPPPRRKICSPSEDDWLSHTMQSPTTAEKKKRCGKKKRKNVPSRFRMSTSSADSGWFSSEGGGGGVTHAAEEEETETLISSFSFSTDSNSSESNPRLQLEPFRGTQNFPQRNRDKRSVSKYTKRGALRPPPSTVAVETENPARLSVFKKMIPCTVDGKVKESFAILKRSENPYEDFKNSMTDMILEKQMFETKDLEQLLHCFLSLNSRHYHVIIVEAFTEIWETIFCIPGGGSNPSVDHQNHRRRRGVSKLASF